MASFQVEKKGNITVVSATDRRLTAETNQQLFSAIMDQVAVGERLFILDLAKAKCLFDFGGIVDSFSLVTNQGGLFVLANVQKPVLDMLELLKLITVFDIYDDIAAATAGLEKEAPEMCFPRYKDGRLVEPC